MRERRAEEEKETKSMKANKGEKYQIILSVILRLFYYIRNIGY